MLQINNAHFVRHCRGHIRLGECERDAQEKRVSNYIQNAHDAIQLVGQRSLTNLVHSALSNGMKEQTYGRVHHAIAQGLYAPRDYLIAPFGHAASSVFGYNPPFDPTINLIRKW